MKVKVKYFGMIAEKVGLTSESIDMSIDSAFNLREYFESKYPEIGGVNYKIAVNQEITDYLTEEDEGAE